MEGRDRDASLEDCRAYLRASSISGEIHVPRSVQHSSYFMPSLYFKAHDVFAMSHSLNPHLIPIEVERWYDEQQRTGERIVDRKADLVAVWDGTKKKSRTTRHPFIQNPTRAQRLSRGVRHRTNPTERLIVDAIRRPAGRRARSAGFPVALRAARGSSPRRRTRRKAIRPKDDFDAWYAWDSNDSEVTDSAREALAKLRQDARQQPTPVVVKSKAKEQGRDRRSGSVLKAYVMPPKRRSAVGDRVRARGPGPAQARRHDLDARIDARWRAEADEQARLGVRTIATKFAISFVDTNDLPRRIADLARSRLRRIRYVWPYEQKYAAVLRDLDFTPDQTRPRAEESAGWIRRRTSTRKTHRSPRASRTIPISASCG
jgi:hypothetical protein